MKLNPYCRSECGDRGGPDCPLPSLGTRITEMFAIASPPLMYGSPEMLTPDMVDAAEDAAKETIGRQEVRAELIRMCIERHRTSSTLDAPAPTPVTIA